MTGIIEREQQEPKIETDSPRELAERLLTIVDDDEYPDVALALAFEELLRAANLRVQAILAQTPDNDTGDFNDPLVYPGGVILALIKDYGARRICWMAQRIGVKKGGLSSTDVRKQNIKAALPRDLKPHEAADILLSLWDDDDIDGAFEAAFAALLRAASLRAQAYSKAAAEARGHYGDDGYGAAVDHRCIIRALIKDYGSVQLCQIVKEIGDGKGMAAYR